MNIFTIGHSNHAIDQFIALLKQHRIESLVDVRRFPSSRRLPHFNRHNLAEALEEHSIEYHWLESLGGHRKEGFPDSPNFGIKDEALRNYADYMLSGEFREGAGQLLEIAENRMAAIMCAEKLFQDCHRKLTSDFLVANGVTVQHILADGTFEQHKLSDGAKVEAGKVTYPESHPLFDRESIMANQILAIAPYWLDSVETWVFDDEAVDLVQEPFVSGVPEMIDELVADIPNARQEFRLLFSAAPFPGYQRKLTRLREEFGGWWYSSDEPEAEGWLCPALFRYFDEAPEEIFVKAEAK